MKLTYHHTRDACYLGYITQAIINNLAPLLFIVFQKQFSVSLEKIGLLISINFIMQMAVDILAARFVDNLDVFNPDDMLRCFGTGNVPMGISFC